MKVVVLQKAVKSFIGIGTVFEYEMSDKPLDVNSKFIL